MGVVDFASGMHGAVQQQLMERFAAQQYADKLKQQAFQNTMQQRQFDSNEELKHAQLDEATASHQAAEQDRKVGLASTLADQIPGGQFMAPEDPAVGMLRTGGRGSLLTPQEERPAVETGPLLPGDTGAAKAQGFIKTRSAKQIDTEADNTRQASATAEQAKRDAETGRHNKAMENKPQPVSTVTIQTVDGEGNPVTRVVPKSEAMGHDYKKGPNATTANRLDSAQAVQQTGSDILTKLSDPNIANALGPVMGRYNSLQEFIGDPPPELSELAGQIESYALASMGVHGMRSAAGAAKINELLSRKHTPASLAATIRGLNGFSQHFLENAGRGGPKTEGAPKSGTKLSAEELLKKYGGQ